MKMTYVIGHKKPDTDSVCASISYSYLKNKLGWTTEPRVLGNINKETKFALDYFKVEEPKYLNDVKVQIKNMSYLKDAYINEHTSIAKTFEELQRLGVTGLPLVDENNKLKGYINVKEMAKNIIQGDIYELNTSYQNILEVLNGKEVLKFDDEIKGEIIAAAYKSKTFTEGIELNHNNILIVADRQYIIDYAIDCGVKLIIIVGDRTFPEELIEKAKEKQVNVISTPDSTYVTANRMKLCNYIETININSNPVKFTDSDYRDDFITISNKLGHTNYPIVNQDNTCVGMLRLIDQNNYEKYNVILVDHNQPAQSVDGLEEADIMEIIDHHNLGNLGTQIPIQFRSMPVGCTCTLIYQIYKENNIEIPENIAGLMLSAVLSDTLLLKSPTTTDMDVEVARKLAAIANLDIQEYGMAMLKAGSSIAGMTISEIVEQDFKTFKLGETSIGIGQVMTLDFEEIAKDMPKYIAHLDEMCVKNNYKLAVLFVTDAVKNGSYLLYSTGSEAVVAEAYKIKEAAEGTYLPDMVSRKKQMYPALAAVVSAN
mgnify:FL=1